MAYLVLARKWRPQTFDAVVGQEHVTQTLKNAIRQNRVAHAFIFTGARGVGKTSVARILAKALNCQNGPSIIPCNQCPSCQEITGGSSVDVYEIDGASNRGINEIRELRENIMYTPAKGRYKIYIIDEVHMLTQEAFNALLKTLEEPPRHIIFMMATTQPHKVPTTILSRCQRYDFRRIPLQDVLAHLKKVIDKEAIEIDEDALSLIAKQAEGSIRDALSLLDQLVSASMQKITCQEVTDILGVIDSELVRSAGDAIINGDISQCINVVDQVYRYGYDIRNFCEHLMTHFRNLMVIKTCKQPHLLIDASHDELAELDKTAQTIDLETLQQYFYTILDGIRDMRQLGSSELMLEILLIKMVYLRDAVSMDVVLARLDSLERSLKMVKPKDIPPSEPKRTVHKVFLQEKDRVPLDIWNDLLRFIRQKNLLLASILQHAHPSWLDEQTIRLSFGGDSFNFEMVSESQNKKRLTAMFSEFFKKNVEISIHSDSGEDTAQPEILDKDQVPRKGNMVHPVVTDVLEIFGGEITSFKERP